MLCCYLLSQLFLIGSVCCLLKWSISGTYCRSVDSVVTGTWLCMRLIAGPKLGLWVVIPCQLIVMIGLDIVYCVTAGKAMYYVYQNTCNGFQTHTCTSFGLSAWIVLFAIIQMVLSMVGTFSTCSQPCFGACIISYACMLHHMLLIFCVFHKNHMLQNLLL